MFSRVCFVLTLQNNRMYNMNVECSIRVYLSLTDLHVWAISLFSVRSVFCAMHISSFGSVMVCSKIPLAMVKFFLSHGMHLSRISICLCVWTAYTYLCIAIIFDFNNHITCIGSLNCANIFNIFPCTRKSTDEEHVSLCNFQYSTKN